MNRWTWRALGAVILFGVVDLTYVVLEFQPDHLSVALLVALSIAVAATVWDGLGDDGPPWRPTHQRPMVPPRADPRLAGFVRLIESHLSAATPTSGLRDRLAAVCDERLARRHGLTRDDPASEALLGADLLEDLAGPVRRLRPEDIEHHLERIERL